MEMWNGGSTCIFNGLRPSGRFGVEYFTFFEVSTLNESNSSIDRAVFVRYRKDTAFMNEIHYMNRIHLEIRLEIEFYSSFSASQIVSRAFYLRY